MAIDRRLSLVLLLSANRTLVTRVTRVIQNRLGVTITKSRKFLTFAQCKKHIRSPLDTLDWLVEVDTERQLFQAVRPISDLDVLLKVRPKK